MEEGPVLAGRLGKVPAQPPIEVEAQRGIADQLNQQVFETLHRNFRVLSLVSGLFVGAGEDKDLPNDAESTEEATLMWSHYADQFQGVCLILNPAAFDNGIRDGGFEVEYPTTRRGLPTTLYDSYLKLDATPPTKSDEEKMRQAFIDFLTAKSPGWQYEHEVRMIYELPKLIGSKNYRRIDLVCAECQARGKSWEECKQSLYRDAVHLPPEAIQGVIFGADCPSFAVEEILQLLNEKPFEGVKTYWTALHSSRYAVQYIQGDAAYIRSFYEGRDQMVAGAKDHFSSKAGRLTYYPAKKGELFDMKRRRANDRAEESTTRPPA